jgi:hypothetical protein
LNSGSPILVEKEDVELDCRRQRFITDVLDGFSLSPNSTLQLDRCDLRGFDFDGNEAVGGGTILVNNTSVSLANCSVCARGSELLPRPKPHL